MFNKTFTLSVILLFILSCQLQAQIDVSGTWTFEWEELHNYDYSVWTRIVPDGYVWYENYVDYDLDTGVYYGFITQSNGTLEGYIDMNDGQYNLTGTISNTGEVNCTVVIPGGSKFYTGFTPNGQYFECESVYTDNVTEINGTYNVTQGVIEGTYEGGQEPYTETYWFYDFNDTVNEWQLSAICTRDKTYFHYSGVFTIRIVETPTVDIQCNFDTIFITNPISKSHSFTISALGFPAGGSYNWEIIQPREGKIEFATKNTKGKHANSVQIRPVRRSEDYEDIEVKVSYTIDSQPPAVDSTYIAVVEPNSLSIDHREPSEGSMPYKKGYKVVYCFQVRDHLAGLPITHVMDWDEKREIEDYENPLDPFEEVNWKRMRSGGGPTDANGIIRDYLKANPYGPLGSILTVKQQIWVEGWDVGTRYQYYYSADAESVEAP